MFTVPTQDLFKHPLKVEELILARRNDFLHRDGVRPNLAVSPLIELELRVKTSMSAVTRRTDWYPNFRFPVNRWSQRSGQWPKGPGMVVGS